MVPISSYLPSCLEALYSEQQEHMTLTQFSGHKGGGSAAPFLWFVMGTSLDLALHRDHKKNLETSGKKRNPSANIRKE